MKPSPWLVLVLVGATVGLVFAGVSTYDFVQHLDRQVHDLHCSFIPGMSHGAGESGCQIAMMSPYSSVFRSHLWGGIPIALPAMSVFAMIAFFALDLVFTRRKTDPRATGFLVLATAVPVVTSIVMATISLTKLGTTCKLCVAIYAASLLCFVGAIGLWRHAVRMNVGRVTRPTSKPRRGIEARTDPAFTGTALDPAEPEDAAPLRSGLDTPTTSTGFLAGAVGIGIAFVAIPVVLYVMLAPDHARFIGTCDRLSHPDDTYGVMVPVERHAGRPKAIEILDPLCPACKAFEQRLAASSFADALDRRAILFPLDDTCNWNVTEATHPGACVVSEAVLCAGDRAPEVIAWAFEEQERIRAEAKADPTAAARIVKQRFPELASCVGSPDARSRLNKSLRWATANGIRVLTPQVFVETVKLCDEDVDLGLEYALGIMLERIANHTLVPPGTSVPAEAPPAPHHGMEPDKKPVAERPEPEKKPSEPDKQANKPVKPAAEPDTHAPISDKPVTSPDKPVTSPDKPVTSPDKPAPSSDKPVMSPDKPVAPPDKPVAPPDKPIAPPDKPPVPGGSEGAP